MKNRRSLLKPLWLLSGFGVVGMGLPDQTRDEGAEQSLAPAASVVDELEEAEVSGSFSCEMPRCGRSQERNKDQRPSAVLTWTSQKPSPSSSRAYSPRAWQTVSWP